MKINTMYIIVTLLLSHIGLVSLFFPSLVVDTVDQGHWLVILLWSSLSYLIFYFYVFGLKKTAPHSIIETFSQRGKSWLYIGLLPLFFFQLILVVLSLRTYSEFTANLLLSETPVPMAMAVFLIPSLYIACGSFESILRTGFLISIIVSPIIFIILLFSLQNTHWTNIMPLSPPGLDAIFDKSFIDGLFIQAPVFTYLGFIPSKIKYNSGAVFYFGLLGILFAFIAVYIPLAIYSQEAISLFLFPFPAALDTVHIEWSVFERLSVVFCLILIIFAVLFLAMTLLTIRLLYQAFVKAQTTHSIIFLIIVSICLYIFAYLLVNWNQVERAVTWSTPLRIYTFVSIPLALYWLGIRRKTA
ncbi:GerAB/ArcD/ProY family transporter [Cytobacillus purgationiresistens]|uniref:Spore germination protein n=1 Tax=Cytobacillus purgationiresistens TaxID=863449 RepID=A0ABU0AKS4_9BACI|nr:GerAB/ArcD/ProY family transporter [Cytobacillus purgationiresistens]MDQ0271847.1 hypothetical protein [Cytobacillus purgationiresistens]